MNMNNDDLEKSVYGSAFIKQQLLQPTTLFAAKRYLSTVCDATFRSTGKRKAKPRGGLLFLRFILSYWWRA